MTRRGALVALGRRACGAAVAALALLPGQPALSQGESLEYAVKATYLYKLVPFVEWPVEAPAGTPIPLCVVGDDPFGPLLELAVSGQRIGDREMTVRRMSAVGPDASCQIVYLGGSSEQSVAEALEALRGAPVLSVTDEAQSSQTKGIVHFVIENDRVRFEIDAQAASASGLKISSKLLDLAVNSRRRS